MKSVEVIKHHYVEEITGKTIQKMDLISIEHGVEDEFFLETTQEWI